MGAPFAIAEVIGTVSFAISGYLVGSRKRLDLFGIAMVSMLTAFGGGLVLCLPACFRRWQLPTL
jgi:uncharacterized membrane protein YeiH